jgi:hypothetical protein
VFTLLLQFYWCSCNVRSKKMSKWIQLAQDRVQWWEKVSCSRMIHLYEVSHGTSVSKTVITEDPIGLSRSSSISSHLDTLRAKGKFPFPF